ncbi:hypothetical protein [Epilithonimonas tenax]|uniref:hypothetical protein n=1 Tax=Epilithonimonas tenax TaxID=191577 RepID=UPI0004876A1E|nr:hypothetical protein [Epilithonimonas tenax]
MKKTTQKKWAQIMLEMDLKSQEGSIWIEEKCKKEPVIKNNGKVLKADIFSPNPICCNEKVIKSLLPDKI